MKDTYKITLAKNKSLTYMFPLVNSEIKFKFNQFLLNSYMSFDSGDELFCVMYSWSSNPDFLKYEGKLMEHPMYVGHADFGEKVVYKFRLTHLMKRGRRAFIEGRCKDFTDNHKSIIIEYMRDMGFNNVLRISELLNKNQNAKSAAPDVDLETVSKQVDTIIIKPENIF